MEASTLGESGSFLPITAARDSAVPCLTSRLLPLQNSEDSLQHVGMAYELVVWTAHFYVFVSFAWSTTGARRRDNSVLSRPNCYGSHGRLLIGRDADRGMVDVVVVDGLVKLPCIVVAKAMREGRAERDHGRNLVRSPLSRFARVKPSEAPADQCYPFTRCPSNSIETVQQARKLATLRARVEALSPTPGAVPTRAER